MTIRLLLHAACIGILLSCNTPSANQKDVSAQSTTNDTAVVSSQKDVVVTNKIDSPSNVIRKDVAVTAQQYIAPPSTSIAEDLKSISKPFQSFVVNNTADAEDVLQEAFLDAFRSLNDFHYRSTFGAWLKKIVINKSINVLRKKRIDLVDLEKTGAHALVAEEPGKRTNV